MLLNLILIPQWCYWGLLIFCAIGLFLGEILRLNLQDWISGGQEFWAERKVKLLHSYSPERKSKF